jgi:hypothetical protein
MSDSLTRAEKGRELQRISSCLAGLGNILTEVLERGHAVEADFTRIEKGLETADLAVARLKQDLAENPDNWGQ